MYASVVHESVNRIAWRMRPAATSSHRTSPGKIGNPAASAEVQPLGRRSLRSRSQIAPLPALGWPPFHRAAYSS